MIQVKEEVLSRTLKKAQAILNACRATFPSDEDQIFQLEQSAIEMMYEKLQQDEI